MTLRLLALRAGRALPPEMSSGTQTRDFRLSRRADIKITILTNDYQHFGRTSCFHLQASAVTSRLSDILAIYQLA
jgi:hypothetical protein